MDFPLWLCHGLAKFTPASSTLPTHDEFPRIAQVVEFNYRNSHVGPHEPNALDSVVSGSSLPFRTLVVIVQKNWRTEPRAV